ITSSSRWTSPRADRSRPVRCKNGSRSHDRPALVIDAATVSRSAARTRVLRCAAMRLHFAVVMLVLGVSGTGSGCGDNKSFVLPDAGPPPDAMEAPETLCEVLPPIASGTCEVTGTGVGKLLRGNVL